MEEKSSIKVRLSTVILLFIILVLIIAIGGMWYYFTKIKPTQNENVNVNETQVKDNKTVIDNTNSIDKEKYELSYGIYNIDTDTIKNDNIDAESVSIAFTEDNIFSIYMGWGITLVGEYEVNSNTIKCNVKYSSYDSSPMQPVNAEIELKMRSKNKIEVTKASSTYIIRTVDMVNNTLQDETKEMSLLPIEEGVLFTLAEEYKETVIEKIVIPAGFDGFNGGAGEIYKSNNKTIIVSGDLQLDSSIWSIIYNGNTILKYEYNPSFKGTQDDYIIYVLKDYIILVTENDTDIRCKFEIYDLNGEKVLDTQESVKKIYAYKDNVNYNTTNNPILICNNKIYFVAQRFGEMSDNGVYLYYIDLNSNVLNAERTCDIVSK